MLPASVHPHSASNSQLNTPEEDDETMNATPRGVCGSHKPHCCPDLDHGRQRWPREWERPPSAAASHLFPSPLPHSLSHLYTHPTPFPSQASLLSASVACSGSGYPSSLPSRLDSRDELGDSLGEDSCLSRLKSASLPGGHSDCAASGLDQPLSLRSISPRSVSPDLYHHTLPPYCCPPHVPVCCPPHVPNSFSRNPHPWPGLHPAYSPHYPVDYRLSNPDFPHSGRSASSGKEKLPAPSASLSLEQRRVFVTYEADDEDHVNEVINFVALLRHNGFDTHIDIFEQQFRSISKIDFMERYLTEKDYLIIIIISPKYHETVTASPFDLQNDERMLNTVYMHKQLQNEFIQNGSKNFRFIPVLFPGAKKCHVPTWLQNTHVFSWPRDRDDILRRLMRVEKYHPPPIGELPTIVSIPI